LLTPADDPSRVLLVERWATTPADDAYRAFRAAETSSRMAGLFAATPTITYLHEHG
jgi:hypothetical protein